MNAANNATNIGNRAARAGKGLYSRFAQASRHQQILSVVVTLLVIVLVVYLCVKIYNSYSSFQAQNVKLINGTMQMNQPVTIDADQLPRSEDQQYGIEFSYATWLYINQINDGSNTDLKHIFHKGSSQINPKGDLFDGTGDVGAVQAPGLWLDGSTNKLYVVMNTFPTADSGQKVFEIATVDNVPMQTWFHLAVVCINKNIDIFVNGKLKKRVALDGVPRLNYGNLYVGGNSYDGYLSNMYYFSHALQIFELDRLVDEGPASGLFKTPEYDEATLAQDWYLTTSYPRGNYSGN